MKSNKKTWDENARKLGFIDSYSAILYMSRCAFMTNTEIATMLDCNSAIIQCTFFAAGVDKDLSPWGEVIPHRINDNTYELPKAHAFGFHNVIDFSVYMYCTHKWSTHHLGEFFNCTPSLWWLILRKAGVKMRDRSERARREARERSQKIYKQIESLKASIRPLYTFPKNMVDNWQTKRVGRGIEDGMD